MNAAEFLAWCRLRGFRSPGVAMAVLGLPEAQLADSGASNCRISARLELACIGYEYCYEHDPPEPEIVNHYALIHQRIRRFLELEPGPRDDELATALIFGLASLVELERGERHKKELLHRAHDLISRPPAWHRIAAEFGQPGAQFAGIELQLQKEEKKTTTPEMPQFLYGRTKNDNKPLNAADCPTHELLVLQPMRLQGRRDGGLSRYCERESGAAVIPWRGHTHKHSQTIGTPAISPIAVEETTHAAAVAGSDWHWSIRLACEALKRATTEQAGVFVVTSETRTVFADRLATRLRALNHIVALDRRAGASLDGPLEVLSARLGIKFDVGNRAAWLQLLADTLERRRSIIPVLLIDAADLLSDPAIRDLAPVLNVGGNGAKIRAVLIGRPELKTRLGQPELAAVNERVCFYHRLEPLDVTDIRSFIGGRMPHDFAIGNIASEDLAFIGDYIRTNHENVASLWRRARLLASDDGERIPSLAYTVKAARMLRDAGGTAVEVHRDGRPGRGLAAQRRSPGTRHRSMPRVAVQTAAIAIIFIVASAMPSNVGRKHTTPSIAAFEQVSSEAVSASADRVAHTPTPPLQTAMLSDSIHNGDKKNATTTPLTPVSRSRPPPNLSKAVDSAPARTQHRSELKPRTANRGAPNRAARGTRRLVTLSVKPPPPEHVVQSSTQRRTQTASVPTAPAQPAPDRSTHGATQLAAASEPACQPYVSQVDFTGRPSRVGGLACHDASGRWWLMNQREAE